MLVYLKQLNISILELGVVFLLKVNGQFKFSIYKHI